MPLLAARASCSCYVLIRNTTGIAGKTGLSGLASVCVGFALFPVEGPGGLPSPADDYLESELDLNELLIQHPAATFYVRLAGHSMVNAGLFLVVDRVEPTSHGRIVVAVIDGEMTVKRLYAKGGRVELRAENPAYKPIVVNEGRELTIWGVVIGSVRQFKA